MTARNIHKQLAKAHQIAAIWGVEDVLEIRPDLSPEQAWAVLTAADRYHDATVGINWDVLACHAEMLFGVAPEEE